jgi:hypothetical protein
MSDIHISLIRFGGQPHSLPHSSLSFFFFLSPPHRSMLFVAGDLTQWHLPVGMKDLDLGFTKVTGKAQLIKQEWRSEGESSLNII